MKQVSQTVYLLSNINEREILQTLERIGRVCYQSEDKITEDSCNAFIKKLISNEHLSVLEHISLTVLIRTNRAVANELVRHRHCAFTQESTRFVKYDNIECINSPLPDDWQGYYEVANDNSESAYKYMVESGVSRQIAREYLPLGLATSLYMTANLRAWRHIIKLRGQKFNHPLMVALMKDILQIFEAKYPAIFGDIQVEV